MALGHSSLAAILLSVAFGQIYEYPGRGTINANTVPQISQNANENHRHAVSTQPLQSFAKNDEISPESSDLETLSRVPSCAVSVFLSHRHL